MDKWVRLVSNFIFTWILFIGFTGGFWIRTPWGRIDLTTIHFWVLLLSAGLVYLNRFSRKTFERTWANLAWINFTDSKNSGLAFDRFFIIFLIVLFGAHGLRHLNFQTHIWDMLPVHQGLFHPWKNSLHPSFACDACIGLSALGEHLSFSFFLLAPITSVLKSDTFLFALQVLIIGGPIYWILRNEIQSKWIWVAFFVIFSSQSLRTSMIWDFREDALAFLGLFGMLIFYFKKKPVALAISFFLALLSKENVFLVTAFFSISVLLDQNPIWNPKARKTIAALVLGFSVFYGFLAFKWLIPNFSGLAISHQPISGRFSSMGQSPGQIVSNLFLHPDRLIKVVEDVVLTWESAKYLLLLLMPFAFFLRNKASWHWLLPALPGLAMNLFSNSSAQRSLQFHYDLVVLPFLIWSCLGSMKKMQNEKGNANTAWATGLAISLCFSGRWPMTDAIRNIPKWTTIRSAHFLSQLKGNQITAANAVVAAHLTHLPRLAMMAAPFGDPARSFISRLKFTNPLTQNRPRGRSLFEATRFVLDLNEDWERDFYHELLVKNFKITQTLGQRWVVLESHQSLAAAMAAFGR